MARRSGFPKIGELRIHNQLQASKHLIRPEWFLERMAIIRRLAGAERYDLDIDFVEAAEMRRMNAEDRGMDEITDVLSYPAWSREEAALLGLHVPERNTDFLPPPFPGGVQQQEIGRLILCPSRIAQDAAHVYHVDFESNLMFVSVHGMCHLLGYDHEDPEDEKAMKAREKEIWDGLVLELESHA